MLITDIKKDKKHYFLVEFSDGTEELIDKTVCAEYCLCKGDELSSVQLSEILKRSQFVRCKERALWYLDRCDRTERELARKLKEASFSEKIIAEVMAFLKSSALIDDRRYAARFAERNTEMNVSKREIRAKLYTKGINRDIIDEILENTAVNEHEQITALIEKKYRSKLTDKNSVAKVYAALCRKGFSFSAVRDVLKQYSEELQYSEEY